MRDSVGMHRASGIWKSVLSLSAASLRVFTTEHLMVIGWGFWAHIWCGSSSFRDRFPLLYNTAMYEPKLSNSKEFHEAIRKNFKLIWFKRSEVTESICKNFTKQFSTIP